MAQRSPMVVLFIVLLLDLFAFTCILPLFPALMEYYRHNAVKGDLYDSLSNSLGAFRMFIGAPDTPKLNSVLFGGALGSLFSLLQYFSSPLIGALSDVYGRKALMLVSLTGSLASYLLWTQASDFPTFVLSRAIGGFSKASISLSTAIATDLSTPSTRGRAMALVGATFSIGFIAGPMCGAYFARQAKTDAFTFYTAPAYFACALTVVEMLVLLFALPESLPADKRDTVSNVFRRSTTLINPVSLFKFSALERTLPKEKLLYVQRIGLVYFLYLFFYSGLEFTLTFLTFLRFNYDSVHQGRLYFFAGVIMVVIQGGYVRRISPNKQMHAALRGISVIIPGFILIGCAKSQWLFYLGLSLYAIASGLVVPCLTTSISAFGSDNEKGALLGVFRSLGALARALGPIIASAFYWMLGPDISYVALAICFLIPLRLLNRLSTADPTKTN